MCTITHQCTTLPLPLIGDNFIEIEFMFHAVCSFQVCGSVTFRTFTQLCTCHHNQFQNDVDLWPVVETPQKPIS